MTLGLSVVSTHRVLCLLAHDNSGCSYSLLCLLTLLDGIPHYTRLWLTVLCPAMDVNQSEVVLDGQTNRVVGTMNANVKPEHPQKVHKEHELICHVHVCVPTYMFFIPCYSNLEYCEHVLRVLGNQLQRILTKRNICTFFTWPKLAEGYLQLKGTWCVVWESCLIPWQAQQRWYLVVPCRVQQESKQTCLTGKVNCKARFLLGTLSRLRLKLQPQLITKLKIHATAVLWPLTENTEP